MTDEERDAVDRVARLFRCQQLETVVRNVRNDEEFLNPSIGTFWNDEIGRTLKESFYDQSLMADVVFNVDGTASD